MLTLSPPLTENIHGGTISWTFTRVCVVGASSNGGTSFTYFGNCAVALLSGNPGGVLVGGTVMTMNAQAGLVIPASVCNESSATGFTVRAL